jgi:hypothetical protein
MKKLIKEILSESIGSGLLQNLGSVGDVVGLGSKETQKEGGAKGQGSGGQGDDCGGGCGRGGKGRRGGGGGGKGGRGMHGNQ